MCLQMERKPRAAEGLKICICKSIIINCRILTCFNWQNTLCYIMMLVPFISIENVTVFF
jgi:hypothetical protein